MPRGHWTTLAMLGALRLDGVAAAPRRWTRRPDADVFHHFVHEALVPALRPGDVVAWDGLGPQHKAERVREEVERVREEAERVREEVERAGATLLQLPPCSPDLSPIEPCWSKVKGHVRDVEPRTPEALGRAAAEGFAGVTAADARGWFANCGYCAH